MLALVSTVAILSQINSLYTRVEYDAETVTADVSSRYFLGMGRFAEVSELNTSLTCGVATVSISYATLKTDATCSADNCTDGFSNNYYSCSQAFRSNSSYCLPIAVPLDTTTDQLTLNAIAIASPSAASPQYVKGFGNATYAFFVTYSLALTGCTTSTVSLSWNARVRTPGTFVSVTDTQVPTAGFIPDYDNTLAALPRHSSFIFNSETSYLPMAVSTKIEEVNKKYIDLGVSPFLELSTLDVYISPVDTSSCAAVQSTIDISSTSVGVYVKDSYDCNAFTDASQGEQLLPTLLLGLTDADRTVYGACCALSSNQTCLSQSLSDGTRACFWVESRGRCYPEFSSTTVDVRGMISLNESVTLSSSHVNLPSSTYFTEETLLQTHYDGTVGRRWHLVIDNQYVLDCNLFVTHSFVSNTHGGICEPSSRRMCDAAAESCSKTSTFTDSTLVYWEQGKAFESADKAREVVAEDKFKTCNCLKQKEVCYRKNGCAQTKKYDLVLMNCLDQGCGNWCNSAGSLQLSLASILLVVIAVLF